MKQTGRALIIKDDQVLLILRYNHGRVYLTVPGGNQEEGESIEETTIREVKEETSVDIKLGEKLTEIHDSETGKTHHLYLAEYIGGQLQLGDDIEMQRMKKDPDNFYKPLWINISPAINQKIVPPVLEEFIHIYLSNK